MEDSVRNVHEQFSYIPRVYNTSGLGTYTQYILAGMGGSHLAAGILKRWKPGINLYVHKTYGLPPYDETFLENSLLIASSYSGNTEEVLSFAEAAIDRRLPLAVITTGGALLELAKQHHLPYIELPNDGIQPRAALGYMLIALATLVGEPGCVSDVHRLGETFRADAYKELGESIAREVGGSIPVLYASNENVAIAYNWKIKCNETGKIPAFYNLLPEANHNEMQGFSDEDTSFHIIMLHDYDDHIRVQKRMAILADMLEDQGIGVTTLTVPGESVLERLFASLAIADWMALAIAEARGVNPEEVPMIETFKKHMKGRYPDRFTDNGIFS